MVIDGEKIARRILDRVKLGVLKMDVAPTLAIIVVGQDPSTKRFIEKKEKIARELGIKTKIEKLQTANTEKLVEIVSMHDKDSEISGIIVQLPLPEDIDVERVLNTVSAKKDVDVLSQKGVELSRSGESKILSPVVGAIVEVLSEQHVDVEYKNVLVIGKGRLVGRPVADWFVREGAHVVVADKDTGNLSKLTRNAEIIVSGAGQPGLIKPDMLNEGTILLDAGTNIRWDKTVGDAVAECQEKCEIFTPVPGGLGTITVAKLFENLVSKGSASASAQE